MDRASRTDFVGAHTPQWGIDDVSAYPGIGQNSNYAYLQAGDGDPRSPFLASGGDFVVFGNNDTPPASAIPRARQPVRPRTCSTNAPAPAAPDMSRSPVSSAMS